MAARGPVAALLTTFVWAVVLTGIAPRLAHAFGEETRITNQLAGQSTPDISGSRIVWQDGRNDLGDIYAYDLGTQEGTRLTTDPTK